MPLAANIIGLSAGAGQQTGSKLDYIALATGFNLADGLQQVSLGIISAAGVGVNMAAGG